MLLVAVERASDMKDDIGTPVCVVRHMTVRARRSPTLPVQALSVTYVLMLDILCLNCSVRSSRLN